MNELKIPPRMEKVLILGHGRPVGRFLDIGCGDGAYAVLLRDAWEIKEVYGVDMSHEAVAKAQKRRIHAVCIDLNEGKLPYNDRFFDVVFAGEIIEHLISPDRFLGEIYRVLRWGGRCVITTPNLGAWYNRIQLLFGWQPYAILASLTYRGAGAFWGRARNKRRSKDCLSPSGGEGFQHIQFFTLRGLKELLILHGLKVVGIQGASFDEATFNMPKFIGGSVRMVDKVLASIFPSLASGVIVVAVKESDKDD